MQYTSVAWAAIATGSTTARSLPSSKLKKDRTMIRFAIDPDKVAKAGAITEENQKTDAKADKSADPASPEKTGSIAAENQKTATKPRKSAAKRSVDDSDDKKLL